MAQNKWLTIDAMALARALAAHKAQDFGDALATVFRAWCPLHSIVITQYSAQAAQTLYHNLDDDLAARSIAPYERGLFVLDPFYNTGLRQHRSGVWRLRDLAPDHFHRSDYYQAFYQHLGPCEEIGLLFVDLQLIVSLEHAGARVRAATLAQLNAAMPLLQIVLQQFLQRATSRPTMSTAAQTSQQLSPLAQHYKLSERETEVMQLVLQGHSSASIAAHLAIAETTVKVHRKHLYQKIGISTQGQLFQRYIQQLV